MKVLISGASGFVGSWLTSYLRQHGHHITKLPRDLASHRIHERHDCLIHLAGRAHVMQETAQNPYLAYQAANVDYALSVAHLAHTNDIKRLIFMSSVKVNGDASTCAFRETDNPAPEDDYGRSKLEAEIRLAQFCQEKGIELVIIRPPLIYGPGVKANLKSLIRLCDMSIPLPFGNINNKRSLISLQNLCHFIELCCQHSLAANQTFLISDDYDVSTTELICTIKNALLRRHLLVPVPQAWLTKILDIIGKHALNQRLLGNLQLNISKAKDLLNWSPPLSFEEGIKATVKAYVDKTHI